MTAWRRGGRRTRLSSAGGFESLLERMDQQDDGFMAVQKRQLELQESESQQRKGERHRQAMKDRYTATRDEALARAPFKKCPVSHSDPRGRGEVRSEHDGAGGKRISMIHLPR